MTASHPRYADHYTGELFFRVGAEGAWTELLDAAGHRTRVLTASFERAYDAVDLVAKRVGKGWELWLGDAFKGTLVAKGRGYSLLIAGWEREGEITCAKASHVLDELGLDPRTSRILGL